MYCRNVLFTFTTLIYNDLGVLIEARDVAVADALLNFQLFKQVVEDVFVTL